MMELFYAPETYYETGTAPFTTLSWLQWLAILLSIPGVNIGDDGKIYCDFDEKE